MASLSASWDLRCSSIPRSVCNYTAPGPYDGKQKSAFERLSSSASYDRGDSSVSGSGSRRSSTNPFDTAAAEVGEAVPFTSGKYAIVFGTERGGLRYRVYPDSGGAEGGGSSRSISGVGGGLVQPIGVGDSIGRSTTNLQSMVDLNGAVPGAVVGIIRSENSSVGCPLFLVLVDDNRGPSPSSASPGAYAAHLVTLHHGSFSKLPTAPLPRMSAAAYHRNTGFVYAAGTNIHSVPNSIMHAVCSYEQVDEPPHIVYNCPKMLPSPGARANGDAFCIASDGSLIIVAVNNSFYAISHALGHKSTKLWTFTQSSQVHPALAVPYHPSSLLLASGRECITISYNPTHSDSKLITHTNRYGITSLPSAILSLTIPPSSTNAAILTFDGLLHIRNVSCLAVPLHTIEIGTTPNNFFFISSLHQHHLLAISYAGEGKVFHLTTETLQEEADRFLKLCINAFGPHNFPRLQLAEAIRASFTATNHLGPEPTLQSKMILKQYLETLVLSLHDPNIPPLPLHQQENLVSSLPFLLVSTAMLCLCCCHINNPSLANRASKTCATRVHQLLPQLTLTAANTPNHSSVIYLCETVADRLLKEAMSLSLLPASSNITSSIVPSACNMEFVEAAVWLLRCCGKHERAMNVLRDKMPSFSSSTTASSSSGSNAWSKIKYESYIAAHLAELFATQNDSLCQLVLKSKVTKELLEHNPGLGLTVFTSTHPQKESQWKKMQKFEEDPLYHPLYPQLIVRLLKSIQPYNVIESSTGQPYLQETSPNGSFDSSHPRTTRIWQDIPLPLDSGRALSVTYLESAVGVSSHRPLDDTQPFAALPPDPDTEGRVSGLHDELVFLLLEGVILERGEDPVSSEEHRNKAEETSESIQEDSADTELGSIYRGKLRRFLSWPNAKYHPEKVFKTLPSSFLREHALLLGRLGRHEDALRILYSDLHSLDLALEYCDQLYQHRQTSQQRHSDHRPDTDKKEENCVYLPLVKVALSSHDAERGTKAAIQVLALRRHAIDRGAALRLLPENLPLSAVARPFLIPALIDSQSQLHRLTVATSLLRAKYLSLKWSLTEAQIRSQAVLHAIPALRSLNLGEPIHTSPPFAGRPTHSTPSPSLPEITLIKHFFPRHVVIQAKITNSSPDNRTLSDVAFVVADSSDDAVLPTTFVPLRTLPPNAAGSAWCVLAASPLRLDGVALLTCELRYTISAVDVATGAPLSFHRDGKGRTYVEELQDVEVRSAEFEI